MKKNLIISASALHSNVHYNVSFDLRKSFIIISAL